MQSFGKPPKLESVLGKIMEFLSKSGNRSPAQKHGNTGNTDTGVTVNMNNTGNSAGSGGTAGTGLLTTQICWELCRQWEHSTTLWRE